MRKIACIALCLFLPAAGAQRLAGFAVELKGFSAELELLASHLAQAQNLSEQRAEEIVAAAKTINEDLRKAPRANALFLVKSEIYKGLLDNPLLSKQNAILLNESLVKGIESKLEKHAIVYSDFSKWILQSTLSELAEFRDNNFLDKYQTVAGNDVQSRAKALRLRKLANYLSPWLMAFNEKSPEDFNALATDVAADLLLKIATKSYYFKEFASQYSDTSLPDIFTIPRLAPPPPEEPLPAASLKEDKQKSEIQSQKELEALEKVELDNPSGAIDALLNKQSEQEPKDAWTPK